MNFSWNQNAKLPRDGSSLLIPLPLIYIHVAWVDRTIQLVS